jgi:toxin ParE1/3/4
MRFVVKKLPIAEQDTLEAALWYDEREQGLGDDFLNEVDAAVKRLTYSALVHRIRFADVRRAPVLRFKFYGIYYLIREQEVWIIAIEHGRRHPRHLQQRRISD